MSEQLDYEGEIALVDRQKRAAHRARTCASITSAGSTLCNEGSVRDWLRTAEFNVTQGKNFDRSGGTRAHGSSTATTSIRGRRCISPRASTARCASTTAPRGLMFPFDYLIAYLSTFTTLKPGDVIVTGTPTGAGARFDPPRWLVPGDVVEVEVAGIGTLRNTVIDEV